jgi:hypothetical protein
MRFTVRPSVSTPKIRAARPISNITGGIQAGAGFTADSRARNATEAAATTSTPSSATPGPSASWRTVQPPVSGAAGFQLLMTATVAPTSSSAGKTVYSSTWVAVRASPASDQSQSNRLDRRPSSERAT